MVTKKSKQKTQFVFLNGKKWRVAVAAAPQKFSVGYSDINDFDTKDGNGILRTFKGERIAVLKPA
jgi:hypothetical protein